MSQQPVFSPSPKRGRSSFSSDEGGAGTTTTGTSGSQDSGSRKQHKSSGSSTMGLGLPSIATLIKGDGGAAGRGHHGVLAPGEASPSMMMMSPPLVPAPSPTLPSASIMHHRMSDPTSSIHSPTPSSSYTYSTPALSVSGTMSTSTSQDAFQSPPIHQLHQHNSPHPMINSPTSGMPMPMSPNVVQQKGRVFISPSVRPGGVGDKGKAKELQQQQQQPPHVMVQSLPAVREDLIRRGSEMGIDLGDFDMKTTLGTGTFGKVLLAKLRPSPQKRPAQTQPHYFAMKVLDKVTVVRLRQVEHLNSERTTLAMVRHPFIVNLFCTFQDERNLYLLLEYVQGGELFSHLRRAGRFSSDVARFYAANLILALEYLHSQDIIYRDLKPENLLIDSTGYLKITDFGFAKQVTDRTYTLCGTPEYLSPEIITATGHGKAADFWAYGVLLFELLAGYPPFFADNPLEIYEKILTGKFSFPPHVDYVAKDLIKRLLTADLSKRLGNLRRGAEDVKLHRWFEGVDWDMVEKKEIRAPIVPVTSTPGDTSNFEEYPQAPMEDLPGVMRAHRAKQYGVPADTLSRGPDPYGYLFPAF